MSTVLIVDDDPDGRALLVRWVSAEGHTVLSAETGEAALELADGRDFDVALLDVRLPGMSGYDLAKRFLGGPTALVMVSITDRDDRPPELDSALWLAKPFTREAVRDVLRDALAPPAS